MCELPHLAFLKSVTSLALQAPLILGLLLQQANRGLEKKSRRAVFKSTTPEGQVKG